MESDLLGIGEMARRSGLTVTALRFYDTAGVFVPASVDAGSGYRKYRVSQLAEARLVARLRRVAMPLADIRTVLACRAQPVEAVAVLDRHLRRLEHGLSDAQRELSSVKSLLTKEMLMADLSAATRLTLPADALLAALSAVRFAVSKDPALPALGGVLLDIPDAGGSGSLTVVATDRYRLAVSTAAASALTGAPARVIAPLSFVDDVCRIASDSSGMLEAGDGEITVVVDGDRLTATRGNRVVNGAVLDDDFPDYERLVDTEAGQVVSVNATSLAGAIRSSAAMRIVREQDGAACDVVVLTVDATGDVHVAGHDDADAPGIGVNREFLLEALAADSSDQLSLELGGPIAPLVFRAGGSRGTVSLLMPTRLQSA